MKNEMDEDEGDDEEEEDMEKTKRNSEVVDRDGSKGGAAGS